MTISILHEFESLKDDGVDTTLVQPSNWNDEHVILLGAGKIMGRDASGAGVVQELPLSFTADGDADFTEGTGYLRIPGGTILERPLVPTGREVRWNSDDNVFEYWDGADWQSVATAVSVAENSIPIAGVIGYGGRSEPTDNIWKYPNGQTLVRADYADLFAKLVFSSVVTMTIASPCVVTWTANGLSTGDPIKFSTTVSLPTGVIAGTLYYVDVIDANTFHIKDVPGGTSVVTSGSQTGTHTGVSAPYGDGNGTTTFTMPDIRGRTIIGHDAMGAAIASRMVFYTGGIYGASLGYVGGESGHIQTGDQVGEHTHTFTGGGLLGGFDSGLGGAGGGSSLWNAGAISGSITHNQAQADVDAMNVVQPGIVMNMLMRVA